MRRTPYPDPPSRTWQANGVATYAVLALAGALVLIVIVFSDQPVEGYVVLGIWGGLTLPGSLACVWGVVRARYRLEWIGSWFIAMGTSVYLVVTTMGVIQAGAATLLMSAPTLLFFLYGLGKTLDRAIQLSLIDMEARRHLLVDGPEVSVND